MTDIMAANSLLAAMKSASLMSVIL